MAVTDDIYNRALNRMGYTWELDEDQATNVRNAIEEAEALLRGRAGNPNLDLTSPEYRSLLIECAWYLVNNRRADFLVDYLGEINTMRLAEGFGCGTEEQEETAI